MKDPREKEEWVLRAMKAMGNGTRFSMLKWLGDPDLYFPERDLPPQEAAFRDGVCVSDIMKKAGLALSTTSEYLEVLRKAGLIETCKCGKWTYCRRDDSALRKLGKYIKNKL